MTTYPLNSLTHDMCLCLDEPDTNIMQSDFAQISNRIHDRKQPFMRPCKVICADALEKLPTILERQTRSFIQSKITELLVIIYEEKPSIRLNGTGIKALQSQGYLLHIEVK